MNKETKNIKIENNLTKTVRSIKKTIKIISSSVVKTTIHKNKILYQPAIMKMLGKLIPNHNK